MKFFWLLLLVPAVGWGNEDAVYTKSGIRMNTPWYIVELKATQRYQVFSVLDHVPGAAYFDIDQMYSHKEIAEDLAEALNEAHERRAKSVVRCSDCTKIKACEDPLTWKDCAGNLDPHAVLVPEGKP